MKKKLFSLLLICFFSLMGAVGVYASGTASIYPTNGSYGFDGSADIGKTFEVEFYLENNAQIDATTLFIKYDPSVVIFKRGVQVDGNEALSYPVSPDRKVPLISASALNNSANHVMGKNAGPIYDVEPDGVSTEAQLGVIKAAAITSAYGGKAGLYQITDSGILFRAEFEVVGSGNTEISVVGFSSMFSSTLTGSVSVDSTSCNVSVSGSSAPTVPETTTKEPSAETTTSTVSGSSSSSSGSSSGGSGSSDNGNATTTENPTEDTTNDIANESDIGAITENNPDNTAEYAFPDLEATPWAAEAVNYLSSKGIVNGYNDGSFLPKNNVTRADFIIMLVNTLGIEESSADNFADVREDKYYAKYIAAAKATGIANGYNDGTFKPEEFITRQDMMVLAQRAAAAVKPELMSAADETALDSFSDSGDISPYAKESIAVMVNAGVVSGSNGKIEPKSYTTRAQTAVIMYNVLKLAEA